MYTIENSKHFIKKQDESGAVYYVLSTHVAPMQQAFYFVNPSMDDNARYLWFYCIFPPAPYRTLAVVDFTTDRVHHFPEAMFAESMPTVDPETGDVYYADVNALYKRSPKPEIPTEKICDLPKELCENDSRIINPATHLTFSPDRKKMFFDTTNSKGWIAGALTLETGEFQVYCRPEFHRNHGQFNPVYDGIALMAEDFAPGFSIRTDENGDFMRLWTVTCSGEEKMWPPLNKERATHEWWSADGRKIYYCKYNTDWINNGVCSIDIFTGEHKLVAPVAAWHAFTSYDETLVVFDENNGFYRGCPSKVGLYNVENGKMVYINTQNPAMYPKEAPSIYHLDPHPRFNAKDEYIVFTTAFDGNPNVAVSKTCDILPLIK